MIEIVAATEEGVRHIAENMQRAHREECEGAGMSAMDALVWSVNDAAITEMAVEDGEPIAVWGASPAALLGTRANVWMLGTDALLRCPVFMCRHARRFVNRVNEYYPTLECVTDIRYSIGCAWVGWLGFKEVGRVATPATIYIQYRRG